MNRAPTDADAGSGDPDGPPADGPAPAGDVVPQPRPEALPRRTPRGSAAGPVPEGDPVDDDTLYRLLTGLRDI